MLAGDRPRNFADVDIAAGIERQAVRRDKLPRRLARTHGAEAGEQLACFREDAEPRAEVGGFLVDRHAGPELPQVTDRLRPGVHVQRAGAVHVMPLVDELAAAVEDLNAVVSRSAT